MRRSAWLAVSLHWPDRVCSLPLYDPVRSAVLRRHAPDDWREIREEDGAIDRLVLGDLPADAAARFVDNWGGPQHLLAGSTPPASAQWAMPRLATLCVGATVQRLRGAGHRAPMNESTG
jgi:hypothetical protein